jgi:FkbM family methyltransferase
MRRIAKRLAHRRQGAQDAPMSESIFENELNALIRGRHGVFLVNKHDAYIGRSLMVYGDFSHKEWLVLAQMVRPGAQVAEIGANIGAHTVPIAQAVGRAGHVYAVEAQPEIHRLLCANLALNALSNVTTFNLGCGAAEGQASLPRLNYGRADNFGGVSLREPGAGHPVRVAALDALIDPPRLDLIKIDVEGMEREVLEGASGLIRTRRPTLYLENDRLDRSAALIEKVFQLGYRAWWHTPLLFDANNLNGVSENVFGSAASFNMLCLPQERPAAIEGLRPVEGADDHPLTRLRKATN